jgi:hypothetical protein
LAVSLLGDVMDGLARGVLDVTRDFIYILTPGRIQHILKIGMIGGLR